MNDAPRPVRLRLSRQPGFNLQEHSRAMNGLPAINCARPGPYGNPYVIGKHGSRINCVRWFICMADGMLPMVGGKELIDRVLAMLPHMQRLADGLKGNNLACWCQLPSGRDALDICHCQVWLALANDADPVKTLRPYCEGITLLDGRENEVATPRLARAAR